MINFSNDMKAYIWKWLPQKYIELLAAGDTLTSANALFLTSYHEELHYVRKAKLAENRRMLDVWERELAKWPRK